MKRITLALLVLLVIDLWGWVPLESTGKVSWFFFVDSEMSAPWYVKLTTQDLLLSFLTFIIYFTTGNRVFRAVGIYFIFRILAMWSFDDRLPMTPFILILLIYCSAVVIFGERFGIRKLCQR